MLPVPIDDYKAIFLDRDAPFLNGKKRAIIHWVSDHLRRYRSGKISKIGKHTRGVDDIVIDGLSINIKPYN